MLPSTAPEPWHITSPSITMETLIVLTIGSIGNAYRLRNVVRLRLGSFPDRVFRYCPRGLEYEGRVATLSGDKAKQDTAQTSLQDSMSFTSQTMRSLWESPISLGKTLGKYHEGQYKVSFIRHQTENHHTSSRLSWYLSFSFSFSNLFLPLVPVTEFIMLFELLMTFAGVAVAAPSYLAPRQQAFSASFTQYVVISLRSSGDIH